MFFVCLWYWMGGSATRLRSLLRLNATAFLPSGIRRLSALTLKVSMSPSSNTMGGLGQVMGDLSLVMGGLAFPPVCAPAILVVTIPSNVMREFTVRRFFPLSTLKVSPQLVIVCCMQQHRWHLQLVTLLLYWVLCCFQLGLLRWP